MQSAACQVHYSRESTIDRKVKETGRRKVRPQGQSCSWFDTRATDCEGIKVMWKENAGRAATDAKVRKGSAASAGAAAAGKDTAPLFLSLSFSFSLFLSLSFPPFLFLPSLSVFFPVVLFLYLFFLICVLR